MSEPTDIKTAQKEKSPVDGALNTIREEAAKALQSTLKEQLKVTISAFKVFKTEKTKLDDMIEKSDEDKADFKKMLGDILG